MMPAKKLLADIDSALGIQNGIISIMGKHMPSAIEYSDLGAEEKKEMLERFRERVMAHKKHLDTLLEIKQDVLEEGNNVY